MEPELNYRCEAYAPARSLVPLRRLVLIFFAASAMRMLAMWSYIATHPRNWFFGHPYEMGVLANSVIHGLGYSSPFGGSTGPTALIAPGYPTLIAAVFLAFGSFTFASTLVIIGFHILVNLVTIWLMMHFAGERFGSRSATIAGALWAVSLPLLWVPAIFWESSISQCSLIGIIVLAARRDSTKAAWILLGTCCGVATLINPALLLSLLAVMIWAAYQTRRFSKTAPALGLLALLLVFAPWPIRNAYQFHAFIPLRSTVGFELYMGNRPGSTGREDDSLSPMFNKRELASYVAMGEVAYMHDKSAEAWRYIRAHPGVFLNLSLRRAYRFWAGTGNAGASPVYELHALLTTVLGGGGLILLYLRRRRALATLMALPLLLFPLPYYITHAEYRYRLNIDPILTVLAAYAVSEMVAAWSRRSALRQRAMAVESVPV